MEQADVSGEAGDPLVTAIWSILEGGDALPESVLEDLAETRGPVFVCLREGGKRVETSWGTGEHHGAALTAALVTTRDKASPEALAKVDAIELCFADGFQVVDMADKAARSRLLSNNHRGVLGIEVTKEGGGLARISPTTVVATNRSPEKWMDTIRQSLKLTATDIERPGVTVRSFVGAQLVLQRRGASEDVHVLYRGKPLVPSSAISRAGVEELEQLLGDFLVRSVKPDGRMQYIYYPSRGEEDTRRNNMIRQWMASLALVRLARHRKSKKLERVAEDNIRYNLRTFYHAAGKLGLIEYNKKVKLGAVALAVMTVMEHPLRKRFKRVEPKLWATIDHLWREGGAFRTFFKPAERNDVQNFYPGEALLAWAARYDMEGAKDAALLGRFMDSFRYYRDWHREQRNPAFIPWHTQAYYTVWKHNRDDELVDFIYEMNDWLIEIMQQWDSVSHPDQRGRFYSPNHPYGPPHASSTGVYMEGLIDAFALARELGDEVRTNRYRSAILRGLRSTRQLTFADDVDMFYISKRAELRGGVRTTVYDNIVRVDNVQHCLLAIFKILAAFEDDDFTKVDSDEPFGILAG